MFIIIYYVFIYHCILKVLLFLPMKFDEKWLRYDEWNVDETFLKFFGGLLKHQLFPETNL